ncbi:glycosyltransferase family 2 protein [Agromyces sp. SYSU T00194]|uniref:glycosyltransferase family 2 protein n=1 Tax=Agromyces chitinivorans TaxID=3158560 RepID=UPI003397B26E
MTDQAVDVVLPCLDEEGALPRVLASLPNGYRALVVDNGSTDRSAEVARAAGATVIAHPVRGYGAAVHAGLEASVTDVVGFADADGSLDLAELPRLVALVDAGEADLVLGRRVPVERGAMPLHARLGNAVIARRVNAITGTSLHDIGPMRAGHREALLALGLDDRRSGYPLELVLRAAAEGLRIAEVDVAYRRRIGVSKVTGTVRGTITAVRDMSARLREAAR